MGWKSTIDLTREEAEDILRAKIDDISSCSDEQLEEAIEDIRGGEEHGYNYRIVNKE